MIKKILNKINSKLFKFNPNFKKEKKLVKIGTIYGGYDVYCKNLINPIILSCGLGEDASFDIDMINMCYSSCSNPCGHFSTCFIKIGQ